MSSFDQLGTILNQLLFDFPTRKSHISLCLYPQFSGEEEAKIKRAAGTYCSNQPFALELIKSKQKKDQRFNSFIQVNGLLVQWLLS